MIKYHTEEHTICNATIYYKWDWERMKIENIRKIYIEHPDMEKYEWG